MEQTEHIVEFMIQAFCADGDEREKYFFKHALVSLVQMAKAEQIMEIQEDLNKVYQVVAKTNARGCKPQH